MVAGIKKRAWEGPRSGEEKIQGRGCLPRPKFKGGAKMGFEESLPKYLMLSQLIWRLVRPFALLVARSTKNTTLDEEMVKAVDTVLSANAVEFENENVETKRRLRDAV